MKIFCGLKNDGQSLFEVIFALAVAALILTGIVALTSTSITSSAYSKNRTQANRYASEAMEYVRVQKEFLGWTVFFNTVKDSGDGSTAGTEIWCMQTLSFSINSTCNLTQVISGTNFARVLTVTGDTNYVDLEVKVSWTDEKGSHNITTQSSIGNW